MNKYIIFTVIFVIFVSGCQFTRDRQASTIDTNYHRGTQGLEIRFTPTAPPPIIYDQPRSFLGEKRDEITVLVEIRNKGAFDIGTTISNRFFGKGYLLLHGYDEVIIRNLKPPFPLDIIHLNELDPFGEGIEGKSKFNAAGGFAVIEFPPKGIGNSDIKLPEGSDFYKTTLVATACYEYLTEAAPQVCIDPDPYSDRVEKACRVGGISTTLGRGAKAYVATLEGIAGGQGAPVVVTNIEEEAMPGRAQFKILISNQGGGDVLHLDAIDGERCGFSQLLSYRDFDYVHYTVTMNDPTTPFVTPWLDIFTIPGKQLKCEPKSPVRLDQSGRAIIFCNTAGFDFFGKSAYKTPLNIKLFYGYTNSARKQIEIRSST